jgi:DNA repair protein RecO (recombination protein O)
MNPPPKSVDGGGVVAADAGRRGGYETRVDHQPGFVLHSYAWRETSLIVETMTRDFGRIALVARGARRPTSQFRGILMPFSPLAMSWSGRGELKALMRAEWQGGLTPLRGDGLLTAFYMNELLVRLLPRFDPHPGLFAAYTQTLAAQSLDESLREQCLRLFELDLLRSLGVAPSFDLSWEGDPVDPQAWYEVDAQRGLRRLQGLEPEAIRGTAAIALARGDLSDPQDLAFARAILRRLVSYHLDGRPLNAPRILRDLRQMS